jgi:hypothetical protein
MLADQVRGTPSVNEELDWPAFYSAWHEVAAAVRRSIVRLHCHIYSLIPHSIPFDICLVVIPMLSWLTLLH